MKSFYTDHAKILKGFFNSKQSIMGCKLHQTLALVYLFFFHPVLLSSITPLWRVTYPFWVSSCLGLGEPASDTFLCGVLYPKFSLRLHDSFVLRDYRSRLVLYDHLSKSYRANLFGLHCSLSLNRDSVKSAFCQVDGVINLVYLIIFVLINV